MRFTVVFFAVALSGCMLIDHVRPENRLSDHVHQLNDEVRWGRIDLAAQRVSASHRSAFLAQHRAWGRNIRIADVDVTQLEVGLPEGRAASTVTYAWIDERTMDVRTTSVRQTWQSTGEGFVLVFEEIVGGEPELLEGAPIATDITSDAYPIAAGVTSAPSR